MEWLLSLKKEFITLSSSFYSSSSYSFSFFFFIFLIYYYCIVFGTFAIIIIITQLFKTIWNATVSSVVWSDVLGKSCNHTVPGRMAQCHLVSSLISKLQRGERQEVGDSPPLPEDLLHNQHHRHAVSEVFQGVWGGHM